MMPRLTYMQRLARELFKGCQNRLKIRSTADERDRDRKLWSFTKEFLTYFPEDDQTTITDAWLVEQGALTCSGNGYRFGDLYIESKTLDDETARRCLLALSLEATLEVRPVKVRGDLRRLLTMLNMSAKNIPEPLQVAAS